MGVCRIAERMTEDKVMANTNRRPSLTTASTFFSAHRFQGLTKILQMQTRANNDVTRRRIFFKEYREDKHDALLLCNPTQLNGGQGQIVTLAFLYLYFAAPCLLIVFPLLENPT